MDPLRLHMHLPMLRAPADAPGTCRCSEHLPVLPGTLSLLSPRPLSALLLLSLSHPSLLLCSPALLGRATFRVSPVPII